MTDVDKKSDKWADDEFPAERILSIALQQGNFLVDKHAPKDVIRNATAKNLVSLGYMTNHGTEGAIRYYAITEAGKQHLEDIVSK